MSVAVVSPASSTAAPRQNRGTTSSAAQAYAALQQDPMQQTGQVAHPHRHRGKASASPSSAAQASAAKPNAGGALNILA